MDALLGVAEPAAVLPRNPSVAGTGVEKDRRRFARAKHAASIVFAGSPVGGALVVIGSRSHSHGGHAQELDATGHAPRWRGAGNRSFPVRGTGAVQERR
jgi:hypothetical protein